MTPGQHFKWVTDGSVFLCREAPQLDDAIVTHVELWEELERRADADPGKLSGHGASGTLLVEGSEYEILTLLPGRVTEERIRAQVEGWLRAELNLDSPTQRPVEDWEFG